MKKNVLEKQDWLSEFQNGEKVLPTIEHELEVLGHAFCKTGNTNMGFRLLDIAEKLSIAGKQMSGAISRSISELLKNQQDMSATILKSALAGISMQSGDESEITKFEGD